jgi:PST family polysaccharide transporter
MKNNPLFAKLTDRIHANIVLKKIIGNTGWLFIDRIIRMGFGLIVSVWVARYLGPEQFGVLNYAIAFVALFSAIATLGLDGIVVRDIARNKHSEQTTLGTAFFLKLIGGIVAVLFCIGTIFFLHKNDVILQWAVGITAMGMIFQCFDTIDLYYQSQVLSKFTVYAKNIAFILLNILKVYFILSKASLLAFVWSGLAEIILGAIGLILTFRYNQNSMFQWKGNFRRALELLHDSWPYILAGISITLFMRTNQLLLAELLGNRSVGIYSAAVRISEVWYFIPSAVISSVQPLLIYTREVDRKMFIQKLQKVFNMMVMISLPLALGMSFFSKYVILILFGRNYLSSAPVLSIHIWAAIFVFLGCCHGPYWLAENLQKYALILTIISAVVSIVSSFCLIPLYREIGAAYATLIAYAIPNTIVLLLFPKTRPLFFITINALLFPFKWVGYKLFGISILQLNV